MLVQNTVLVHFRLTEGNKIKRNKKEYSCLIFIGHLFAIVSAKYDLIIFKTKSVIRRNDY